MSTSSPLLKHSARRTGADEHSARQTGADEHSARRTGASEHSARQSVRYWLGVAAAATVAVGLFLVSPTAVLAETPSAVAEEVAVDGVFVGVGRRGFDEDALIAAVEDARFDGLRVVVVVPRDPQPTPAAFARRIQEQTEADAALVFPDEGPLETYVIEDLSASRIRATEAAREFVDPARAVEAFATEVVSVRETGTPEIVSRILNALVLLTLVVGVVVALELGIAWLRKPSKEASV